MGGLTVSFTQDEKKNNSAKIHTITLGSFLDTFTFHQFPSGICALSMNVRGFVGWRTNVH